MRVYHHGISIYVSPSITATPPLGTPILILGRVTRQDESHGTNIRTYGDDLGDAGSPQTATLHHADPDGCSGKLPSITD